MSRRAKNGKRRAHVIDEFPVAAKLSTTSHDQYVPDQQSRAQITVSRDNELDSLRNLWQ